MKNLNTTDPIVSAYVDASAGSGKTKLLVDRIIRMLLYGVQPSKILCITFTNAAANEMNERLRNSLLSFLTMPENDLQNFLHTLNEYLPSNMMMNNARNLFSKFMSDSPKIQTLHSFCSRILQKMHILESNDGTKINTTTILDENEKQELLRESFNEIIHTNNSSLTLLLRIYDASYIFELICEFWNGIANSNTVFLSLLNNKNLHDNDIENILQQKMHHFCNVDINLCREKLIDDYINSLNNDLLLNTATILESSDNITSKEAATIIREFLKNRKNFNDYVNIFLTNNFQPRARLALNAKMSKEFPHIQEFLLNEQTKIHELISLIHDIESCELNAAFNIIALKVLKIFHMKKRQQNLFEYSDLIRYTTEILAKSDMELLYSIDMSIDHIMIDEAQDLSSMQWCMIQTITEEFFSGIGISNKIRTIFIVGDFKQAIFGFQGSAPKVFQNIKTYYRNKVIQANQKWCEVELNTCYRCTPEILNVVDRVCNTVNNAFNVEHNIKHNSIHETGYGAVEIHDIDFQTIKKNTVLSWQLPTNDIKTNEQSIIAENIAQTISDWISTNKSIGQNQKTIEPQDIMILLRKRSKIQDYIVSALQTLSIPVSNLATKVVANNIVIYELISAIQFAVQPFDDMNLVALLRSHPFNFSNEEITQICMRGAYSVWERVNNIQILNDILTNAATMNLQTFVQWYLCNVYCNVNSETVKFMDYVFTYYKVTHISQVSLRGFLHWLEDFLTQKQQIVFDKQSIAITTVHSAKGLEAPIVILADASFSNNTPYTKFACEDDIFILNTQNSSRASKELITRYNQELSMESMRLLYVAMTRAKDELHVFGYRSSQNTWYSLIQSCI